MKRILACFLITAAIVAALFGISRYPTPSRAVSQKASLPPELKKLCDDPWVIRCVGFDSEEDLVGTYGDNHGAMAGASKPEIDFGVKSSGSASLKFTIPPRSPADSSGSYFTNFSEDLSRQFGENAEFYIQWRQRFSPAFISTVYAGGGGWKQVIIGTGDQPGCSSSRSSACYSSCTALEVVVQNTYHRGFPQMYNSCTGSTSHAAYDSFQQAFGNSDFKLQNGRSFQNCLYSRVNTSSSRSDCFKYFPNEWMTFQVHVKTGPRKSDEFVNSSVQLRVAREGQEGQLVIDWGPYNLTAGSPSSDQKFGKVWLLPYNTGKDNSIENAPAYTWYDDLIISTRPVSMNFLTADRR